jgi:hypothetical protein
MFQLERSPCGLLPDILKVFAGLETDRPAWWNPNFLARSGVSADAALSGLYLKHSESAQLDAVPTLHGKAHGIEDGVNRDLSLDLGDVGDL